MGRSLTLESSICAAAYVTSDLVSKESLRYDVDEPNKRSRKLADQKTRLSTSAGNLLKVLTSK